MSITKMLTSNIKIQFRLNEIKNQSALIQNLTEQNLNQYDVTVSNTYSDLYKENNSQFVLSYWGPGNTQYINNNNIITTIHDDPKDTQPYLPLTLKYLYIGNSRDYNIINSDRKAGVSIIPNGTSGKINNTNGKLYFDGYRQTYSNGIATNEGLTGAFQTGNWEIHNDDSDSEIGLTYGNNTVIGGNGTNYVTTSSDVNIGTEYPDHPLDKGTNNITLGDGNNSVSMMSGQNMVHLGQGNNNISVFTNGFNRFQSDLFKHTIITGDGDNNVKIFGQSSIINLGNGNNTVNLSTEMLTTNPINNILYNGTGHLDVSTAIGNATITAMGSTNIHGGDTSVSDNSYTPEPQYLNLTLNAYGEDNIFTAGKDNTTLNAAHSSKAIEIFAANDKTSRLVAITGSGDDTLTAGHGQSIFTGGAGDNLFAFTKENTSDGSTIIKDFSASEGNQIALFDYGLNRNTLKQLLKTSQNDTQGNAVLDLNTNTITLQGVSVSELNINQFFVYNNPTSKII